LYGTSISLQTALFVTLGATVIGTAIGTAAGFLGGRIDELVMRITDVFFAFPSLVLAMLFAASLGPSLSSTMIAILATWWPVYTRLARGSALSAKEKDYVEAARAIGEKGYSIVARYLLPNMLAPIVVKATLDMGSIILVAAGLSFIGFGAQPPTPEWGTMVAGGRLFIMNQWWISTFPGLAILASVLGFNFVGDGIRDILDPRMRGETLT
jgi:peptide/nickel transport system permease protein